MYVFPTNITEEHRTFLFDRKAKTGVNVAVQIREAIDDYMIKHKEVK